MLSVVGARLFTLTVGEGPRTAVVLHGGPGASHDYLRPQMDDARPDGWQLFYYDQRGAGRSPLDAGTPPADAPTHVADLEAVRLHLGLDRLSILGYSWGGLLALLYALAHPESVERLILISPAPPSAAGAAEMRARLARASARPEVAALKARLDLTEKRARFALAVAGYFVDPARALELTPFVVQQRAEQAVWRGLGDYDLRPTLSSLSLPTLIVHGQDDPIPIEGSRETARALGAELLDLPRCGHVPYIEAAEALFAATRRFLAAPLGEPRG